MKPLPKFLGEFSTLELLTLQRSYMNHAQRLRNLGQSEHTIQDFEHRAFRIKQHLEGRQEVAQ